MTGKIFRNFVFVCCCVFLVSVGMFTWVLYGSFESNLTAELRQQTALIADAVEDYGMDYLERVALPNRVTLVAGDGTVLYDSQVSAEQMENHAQREEIGQALESGWGEASRASATLSERTVYIARRLEDGTVLRVAESQRTAAGMLLELARPSIIILGAALVLCMLLAFRLSRRLVTPILELDLEHPERARTYTELSPLLTRLSRQNETIREQMDALRRQQEEFSDLTDHMSEGILVLDAEGQVLSCNSAAARLLGERAPERGENMLQRGEEDPLRPAVEQALQGRRGLGRVERDPLCVQIMADPILRGREVSGCVLVLLDVTERENSERLRREFTANVSHELKTPLTSISGMAEIMSSGIVRPEDMQEFAGDILRESRRLIALVEDIIHLSRLDEGGQLPERSNVEMLALCNQVVERLRRQAEQAGVSLELRGGNFTVHGVPAVLDETVYNLCENALKYNRPGGRVTVTCDSVNRVLTVADTGIGIPVEEQQRVFERFYRVDKSRSRQIGGTGLGLSIVKHGAALHDAVITLSSTPGEGTTVALDFPKS